MSLARSSDANDVRAFAGALDLERVERVAHVRRISYFMLFRVGVLALFTVLAAVITAQSAAAFDALYTWLVWGALSLGFLHTVVFGWLLRRVRDLDAFVWGQTAADIVLSAAVVQMSGGVSSGFQFLYLIAILGAAIMGDRRQCWAAAGTCALIYSVMSMLELVGAVTPQTPTGDSPLLAAVDLWRSTAQTLAAMVGVAVLAGYLNAQLASQEVEIGKLRSLTDNILRSLTSGLLTTDTRDRLIYFNPTAHEILGLGHDDLGKHVEDVLPGVGAVLDESPAPAARLELEVDTRDGGCIHLGLSAAPVTDPEGRELGRVINFQDVTALHELGQQVRRNERLAAIGQLSASVAHEVRNPLAAISGSAELLAGAELGEEDARLLSVITRESSRLSQLVTDLLAFTRPRAPQRVRLDLARTVAEATDAFRADPGSSDIQLHVTVERGVETDADPSMMAQVIWNLLRNASDAMKGQGEIHVDLSLANDSAVISVWDTGPGIAADELERVFDPFFTTKEHGTGFGLALVNRAIDEHGGTITVESPPSRGAHFTIRLPLAQDSGLRLRPDRERADDDPSPRSPAHHGVGAPPRSASG